MEQPQQKKMSKGCMVGLIIAGFVLLLVVVVGLTCYFKRDELAKFGVVTIVTEVKKQLAEQPVEGVDTTQFNALADAFLDRFEVDTVNFETVAELVQSINPATSGEMTYEDIERFEEALIQFYPELAEAYQTQSLPDTAAVLDADTVVNTE